MFWSSGVDFDAASFASLSDDIVLDARELPAHKKAELMLQLPQQFIIVFEPVTHAARFIDVQGEPTDQPQHLTLSYNGDHAPTETTTLRPGRCTCRSTTRPAFACCPRCSSPPTRCIT